MAYKDKLERYLRENQVPYQVQHHAIAYTAQDVAASEHLPGKLMAKVVMAVADARLVMLVLPAPDRINIEAVADKVGAKDVRLAREEEFAYVFPGCEVGAMPPFGNLYGITVLVDTELTKDAVIYFQAGTHTDTISTSYTDFARLAWPIVAPISFEADVATVS